MSVGTVSPCVNPGLGHRGQLKRAPDQELREVEDVLLAVVLQQVVRVALAHPLLVELVYLPVGLGRGP